MDSTGPATPSPPNASAPAERTGGASFSGNVVGVKREDGVQTVEVQTSQGKVRVEADGDFRIGERVKVSVAGNGSAQLEKAPAAPGRADGPATGYILPRNLEVLKDLRVFEEQVARWVGGQPRAGGPLAGREKELPVFATLPRMLMQAMGREGGREFLSRAAAALNPDLLEALLASLEEEAEAAPGPKAALSDLLRAVRARPTGPAENGPPEARVPSPTTRPEAFLQSDGDEEAPWFGRVAERREADGIRLSAGRTGYAGSPRTASPRPDATGQPAGGQPGGGHPFRYVLDLGGSKLEAFSAQRREPGDFSEFVLERQGERVEVRFRDPAVPLPKEARAFLERAEPAVRQGMVLASRYLQEFREEPYYGDLVKDFGAVLAHSGLLQPASPGEPPTVPRQEELDGLLKLFVAFPRAAEHADAQAATWGKAVRDPETFLKLLNGMAREDGQGLLRPDTPLRLGARGAEGSAEALPLRTPPAPDDGPQAVAALLRKLLPEVFLPEDLARAAKEAGPAAGKEHETAKFLLQAAMPGLPQDAPVPEGRPAQFYFYQGQEWRNLQVTWRRESGDGPARSRKGPRSPLQVKVETQSRHMGRVEVGVAWEPKGARLEFRNQFRDVRDLLARSLPVLEKSLSLLGFRIAGWNYGVLPDDTPALAAPGGPRPSGLLDLKG